MQPCILWSTSMFFWKNCGIGVHEVDKINANQYFKKKIPFKGKWGICIQFGPEL